MACILCIALELSFFDLLHFFCKPAIFYYFSGFRLVPVSNLLDLIEIFVNLIHQSKIVALIHT